MTRRLAALLFVSAAGLGLAAAGPASAESCVRTAFEPHTVYSGPVGTVTLNVPTSVDLSRCVQT